MVRGVSSVKLVPNWTTFDPIQNWEAVWIVFALVNCGTKLATPAPNITPVSPVPSPENEEAEINPLALILPEAVKFLTSKFPLELILPEAVILLVKLADVPKKLDEAVTGLLNNVGAPSKFPICNLPELASSWGLPPKERIVKPEFASLPWTLNSSPK